MFNRISATAGAVVVLSAVCCVANGQQSAPASQTTQSSSSDQTGTQTSSTQLQSITVTGSMIRNVDVETAQPVTELTHEAIQQQGFLTTGQILQNVSSVGSPGTSTSSSLGDVIGQYASLRGLGATRTLVLVNGQRWATDIFGQTDLSTIPSSIIDHVEILQDGASAIYGSDAIAGVVNIITKKNFDGLQVDAYGSMYSPGSSDKTNQLSLTGGKTFDRGDILFNITSQNSDGLLANQRSFSQYSYFSYGPNYPQSINVTNPSLYGQIIGAFNPVTGQPTNTSLFANGPIVVNPGQNGQNINNYHLDTCGVQYPSPTYFTDCSNQAYQETLLPQNHSTSFTLQGDFKFTDHITGNFSAILNTNNSPVAIGGYPLSSSTPANGANLAAALGLPAGSLPTVWYPQISANSYYNPLPGNNLGFELNLADPNRTDSNTVKQYGYHVGLEGDFSIGDRQFNWDAGYGDYKYNQSSFGPGNINLVNLYNAVGPSFLNPATGTVECGAPGNVIAGCVPLNAFSGAGGLTPAEINYLNIVAGTSSYSEQKTASVNLTGNLFTLPTNWGSGDITFAVGADHRDISGGATPDPYTQLGLNTNLQQNVGSGSYDLTEGYAEINAPLLKDATFAKLLDIDIADRYSHYSNFGNTNNRQFKISWKPIDDLLLRASSGTGFRAPSIANLYGGAMQSFTSYTDPCDLNFGLTGNPTVAQRCQNGYGGIAGVGPNFYQLTTTGTPVSGPNFTSVTPFYTGANAALQPETSKSFTYGFVYSPQWLEGFNINADFYRVKIKNVITLPTASSILDNCYLLGETQQCDQFQRAANGQVINLLQALINEGYVDERGEDIGISYLFPETPVGKFKVDMTGTYIKSVDEQTVPGTPVVSNTLGSYDTVLGPLWRFRATTNINWSYGDFGATWTIRYYSSLTEPCNGPNPALSEVFPCSMPNADLVNSPTGLNRQGALAFNDLQVSWAPWKGGRFALGANDIFNRMAPLSYSGVYSIAGPLGPTGTDGYTQFPYNPQYDYGRVVYLKFQQVF
jgi:iron complex outermembrane receptor protein